MFCKPIQFFYEFLLELNEEYCLWLMFQIAVILQGVQKFCERLKL